ncbi:sulfotransferase family 2 domain-containing protein [Thalassolituus oleivorans]|uniref:sulfotransferase family 2 domain-containing protein n=1 Tax=Thalassolituus oleivorans TaxID=187493 RepID=UPI0023F35A50|nr:sulfotransferase family 2 domain-containing protein [Thalassolituus oleivorans]
MNKQEIVNTVLSVIGVPPHHRENFINYVKNPYSYEEDLNEVIYIHIPKAAGKAISYSLLNAPNGTGHTKLYMYERNRDKFDRYFKFTFVRNPWDRLVSAFFYVKNFRPESNDRKFFDKYIGQDSSFESFVMRLQDEKFRALCMSWEHFTPQIDFVRNSKGEVALDFVGRLEDIEDDFERLCAILGKDMKLSVRNSGERSDYQSYYSAKMIDVAAMVYAEDIKIFGYVF